MPVFSSNADIPKPPDQWCGGDIVPVRINLPARAVPQLEWLSERWTLNMSTIAADILVAATSGRYLLAQLAAHMLSDISCECLASDSCSNGNFSNAIRHAPVV